MGESGVHKLTVCVPTTVGMKHHTDNLHADVHAREAAHVLPDTHTPLHFSRKKKVIKFHCYVARFKHGLTCPDTPDYMNPGTSGLRRHPVCIPAAQHIAVLRAMTSATVEAAPVFSEAHYLITA